LIEREDLKILLTGRSGQVGWELERQLASLGEVVACDRAAIDLGRPETVAASILAHEPQIIVNAAAYTAVDLAEREPEVCFAVNAESVSRMARHAARTGALLVHYSTDYVFDGRQRTPYREADRPAPINVYGRSKLAGEQAILDSGCRHLIFRTSWVYAARGRNFVLTMLRLARERTELRVVDDQIGAPTWAHDIACATLAALRRPRPLEGMFHLTAGGSTSWFGFASVLLKHAGLATPVLPIATSDFPTAAARPSFSVLDSSRFENQAGLRLGAWDERLFECMGREGLSRV